MKSSRCRLTCNLRISISSVQLSTMIDQRQKAKLAFYGSKFQMVSLFWFFNYLQKLYFFKWVFFYSLKIQSTNTIFLYALEQVCHFYKVLLLQQGGFVISNTFWHLYSFHINLSIQHFSTDYGIISHQFPVFTIVLPWIGPVFHEYLPFKPMLFFGAHAATVQVQGYPLSYFSRQIELLLNLFLQAIHLQDSPPLWSFFRPRSDSFKTDLTAELTHPFKLVKNM